MISHNPPFVFVHVKKTGGSSITKSLSCYSATPVKWSRLGGADVTGKHWTATRYIDGEGRRTGLGRRWWNHACTFTVVRNPWDRMVSMYHHLQVTSRRRLPSFDEWISQGCSGEPTMSSYLTYRGRIAVNCVLRYETLRVDFEAISKSLGLRPLPLEKLNKTERGDYREYYTARTEEMVGDLFAEDIGRFGYSFG